jgi:hypothetical protein
VLLRFLYSLGKRTFVQNLKPTYTFCAEKNLFEEICFLERLRCCA